MDGKWHHLPGENPLSELAPLFNPEQAFLFHHLSDAFFRKTRFLHYPIVQVTRGRSFRCCVKTCPGSAIGFTLRDPLLPCAIRSFLPSLKGRECANYFRHAGYGFDMIGIRSSL